MKKSIESKCVRKNCVIDCVNGSRAEIVKGEECSIKLIEKRWNRNIQQQCRKSGIHR